jgi:hypothetical protein
MDDGGVGRARSSSEEKEANLTPAQSRRKAQNRAAYVPAMIVVVKTLLTPDVVNAPSANAKNAMYATSKPSSTPSKATHILCSRTTSA